MHYSNQGKSDIESLRDFSQTTDAVYAQLVLGNPQTNCSGNGICDISIVGGGSSQGEPAPPDCPCTRVICTWLERIPSGQLQMRVPRTQLRPDLALLFQSSRFEITSAYRLPQALRNALRLREEWIAPGVYPVGQDNAFFTVVLTLSEKN